MRIRVWVGIVCDNAALDAALHRVTGRFGQDPFRPEKTWTFRPKLKHGRFGQE